MHKHKVINGNVSSILPSSLLFKFSIIIMYFTATTKIIDILQIKMKLKNKAI